MSEFKVIWDEALKQLYADYANESRQEEFELWVDKLRFISLADTTLHVAAPSGFFRDQVLRRGDDKRIHQKLTELTGQDYSIQIEVAETANLPGTDYKTSIQTGTEKNTDIGTTAKPAVPQQATEPQPVSVPQQLKPAKQHPDLRDNYTFENFVVGDSNTFAYNAALTVAKNPGRENNPLLIYGGVGLGKTHLMVSIGNYLYQENPNRKIIYTSAENFTNEFIQSLTDKTTAKFKNKYRSADILLIDDIHFLQNKDGTQEELFYTFDSLYNSYKHMVFTCDRPVSELKNLEDRLRSRFTRGLNVDLQLPGYETRRAILQKKLEQRARTIQPEIIDYIAKNVNTNVRDLEACLNKLIAYSDISGEVISVEKAGQLLRDTINPTTLDNADINVVIKVVASEYGLTANDLKKKNNKKQVAYVRQLAMYLANQLTECSTTELGAEFNRDHSTVIHSINKVENLLKTDPQLEEKLQLLVRSIMDHKKSL